MKYIVKGIDEINKIMKAIDAIDENYFGKIDDSDRRKFKNGQLGYYDVEVGFYDDEYTFYPYSDQEKMKAIYNVLNIIRSDFSEMCIELHKSAIDKLEYSIENKLKKDERMKCIAETTENEVVWHDLRKDPNDLPKRNGNVVQNQDGDKVTYDYLQKQWRWTDGGTDGLKMIAWCEVPRLEVK